MTKYINVMRRGTPYWLTKEEIEENIKRNKEILSKYEV